MAEAPFDPIRTVAVIGAGEQGRTLALRCAAAGFVTVLEDVLPVRLRQARDEVASSGFSEQTERLRFATTVEEAVREADLAIDFVPDQLESKLEIFSLLDRMAPPKTILCTPTRALSISDLAACTYRPDRCVALQMPSDAAGGPAILVRGAASDLDIVDQVSAWLKRLGFGVTIGDDVSDPGPAASTVRSPVEHDQ